MKIQELRNIGRNKLAENNVDDVFIKIDILLQHLLKINKTELIINQENEVTKKDENKFFKCIEEVISGKPIQYITKSQEFMNLKFYVDENVLIPQPDTEILVEEVIKRINEIKKEKIIKVLDLCTGSGALALALASAFPDAEVYACDLSTEALSIAGKNAVRLNLPVCFFCHDVLEGKLPASVTEGKDFQLMVSNPPYVLPSEKPLLHLNVIGYEPNMALFVKETDPLAFYRALTVMARSCLQPGGFFLAEINEAFPQENIRLLAEAGFVDVEVRKDFRGKCRMIRGRQPFEAI